jgi:hypothetical protein
MAYHPNQTTGRPPAGPRPARRDGKPWIWALVGIVVLVGLFAFGAAAQSFSNRPDKDDATAAAPAPAKTTTPAKAPTTKPAATGPKIGSSVRDGQFAFVVTAVDCGKSTLGTADVHLTADGKYCVLTVSVHNVGGQSRIFTSTSQKAYDADGTKFSSDTEAGFYANNANQTLLKKLNPGDQVTEKLVFDVPKSIKLTTLELHDSPFSGGVKVSLKK